MENTITDREKINKLIDYYKDNGLLIVGLNDSQGVNTTSTFFKKGLLEYLTNALTSDQLTPEVINAFSLTMNKTEHIDYFLKNNLSLEEHYKYYEKQGLDKKEIIKKIAKDRNVNKNEIYMKFI